MNTKHLTLLKVKDRDAQSTFCQLRSDTQILISADTNTNTNARAVSFLNITAVAVGGGAGGGGGLMCEVTLGFCKPHSTS